MNDSIREICEQYSEDDYLELCSQADCLGMDSLTEEQQIVVDYWRKWESEVLE